MNNPPSKTPIRAQMYDVTPRDPHQRRTLPSERRDFAPTPAGWVGIVVLTGVLGWLIFHAGGDDAGTGWLVASAVLGYFLVVIAWAVIRRRLDQRDDRVVRGY